LFGLGAGSAAYGQVFNVHDIQSNFAFYGYNIMAFGQGVVADPGNNIWNGYGNGGFGYGNTFGGGRPNDALLNNNPGNPYAHCENGQFVNGPDLFVPANAGTASTTTDSGNVTSAGVWTPITVPVMTYGFDTYSPLTNASTGTIPDVSAARQQVAEWIFQSASVVNGASPGAGTAANPLGAITLSNVPPGNYSLYLFAANPDGTRGATFTSSSGTPSNGVTVAMNPYNGTGGSTGQGTPGVGPLTNFVFGEDYVVFNNVTPAANGTLQITWAPVNNTNSGFTGEGDFNGLQLAVAPPVQAPPYINQEPTDSTNDQTTAGALATILASGYPALSYQWYSYPAGTAVPGQTSNTLAFAGALAGQSGNYFVIATNVNGAVTSSVVSITIASAPLIASQSSTNALVLYRGQNAFTLSVSAFGAPPLYYYWQANGATVAVTTNVGTIQFANVTASANYTCLLSNSFSTATTLPLPVTIVAPPTSPYIAALLALNPFAYWPLTENNPSGTTAYDYIRGNNGVYNGVTPGAPGPTAGFGATSYAYSFPSGAYVDVPAGTANALNITGPMTMITWILGNGSANPGFETIAGKGDSSYREDVDTGGLAHFADPSPDAQGGPIVSVSSWHQIVGVYTGTNESLYVDGALVNQQNVTATPGNTLDFWIGGAPDYAGARNFNGSIAHVALFTNVLSTAQVQALFNAAETPPFLYVVPTNFSGFVGGDATFTVAASGYQPISYQWTGPGGVIPGATNATLLLTDLTTASPVNSGPGTYFCTVTNLYGATNTPNDGSIALTVSSSSPFFVQDVPSTIYGILGSPVDISVVEAGNSPITNQWFYGASSPPTTALQNSGRISGANSPTLVIANAQPSDQGFYQLAVTNGVAPYSANSQIGQLILQSEPLFNNGAGWTFTGDGTINNNVLTVTAGSSGEANAIFFNTPMYIGAFALSFTYQASPSAGSGTLADGITFCMQNSAAGVNAVGGGGGSIGYAGITNSAAIAIDLYNIAPGGYQFVTGGLNPANTGNYVSLSPAVSLAASNPVNINIVYDGNAMSLMFHDTVAHGTYTTNIIVGSIPNDVGGTTAYIGFTGGTGADYSSQTVANFSYVPLAKLSATVSGSNVVLSWPVGIGGYVLQTSANLVHPSWTTIPSPYAIVGQNYQVNVPKTGAPAYFRLSVPLP